MKMITLIFIILISSVDSYAINPKRIYSNTPAERLKFNCGGKRANVDHAYALDGVLDRTTDAYRRRNYPQFRLKFGVEF